MYVMKEEYLNSQFHTSWQISDQTAKMKPPSGVYGVDAIFYFRRIVQYYSRLILLPHSYLFTKFCASPSNLWGSVSTVIGCSITSWFLMMMQFQVGMSLKGMYHTAVARIATKKSATSSHSLISRRPHTRTHTWKYTTPSGLYTKWNHCCTVCRQIQMDKTAWVQTLWLLMNLKA